MNRYRLCLVVISLAMTCSAFASITVDPIKNSSFLEVREAQLPGQVFKFRMPEYVNTSGGGVLAEKVVWTQQKEGEWSFHWDAPKEIKHKHLRDFFGTAKINTDTIDINVAVTNPFEISWSNEDYWMFCFMAGAANQFHDPNGRRIFVHQDGKFVSINDFEGVNFNSRTMGSCYLNPAFDSPLFARRCDAKVMAKVSKDGKWVLAIVSNNGTGASWNLDESTSCIHQNWTLGKLKPKETKIFRCRVYLFQGSLDQLWSRYQQDFEDGDKTSPDSKQIKSKNLTIDGIEISTPQESAQGYIPSVWAPATRILTLENLHKNRPLGMDKDPVQRWIADQIIRDESRTPSIAELLEQKAKFKRVGKFWLRQDQDGTWVCNDLVGLRFANEKSKFGVISFYNIAKGIEMLNAGAAADSIFRIQVLRYRPDGTTGVLHFGQEPAVGPDTSFATEVGSQQAKSATQTIDVKGDTLTIEFNFKDISVPDANGVLKFIATVQLGADDPLTRWRCAVDGQLSSAGISQVRCPVLSNLGYQGENDFMYAWGSQRGIYKPRDTAVSMGVYPKSQWAIQHFSISFGTESVLYVACHDPDSYVKSFKWNPGSEMFLSAYVPNTGVKGTAKYQQPYDCVIGPMQGDWYDAAKLYRKWVAANAPWAKKMLYQRQDICRRMLKVAYWIQCGWQHDTPDDGSESWAFESNMYTMPPNLTVDWYRQVLAVSDERLGTMHNGWQSQVWDTYLPTIDWTPLGPQVSQELKRESSLGMSTTIYTNPCWWDKQAAGFNDPNVQKAIVRSIDGSQYYEDYNCRAYMLNWTTNVFQEVMNKLAQKVRSLGSNGIYYDQFSGILRGGDYDPNKKLSSLGRGGNWLPRARQQAIENVRKLMGPDFGFTSEYFVETDSHLYDAQSCTVDCDPLEGPLVPIIYSGYIVQFGAGLRPDTQPVAATISLGKGFLWGTAWGRTQFAVELRRYFTRNILKQLVQLRTQLDDFVVFGEMLRPPAFDNEVPRIAVDYWNVYGTKREIQSYDAYEAALWKSDNGKYALLVMNYDSKPHQISFQLSKFLKENIQPAMLEPAAGNNFKINKGMLILQMQPRTGVALVY